MSLLFRFCPHCASALEEFIHEGRKRNRCISCGWVHYKNPTVGVAVVLIEQDRLLLGERRGGGWCIPCGHVEWDEAIDSAAIREFQEETGLVVTLGPVVAVHSNFHNPHHHTVGVWYWGNWVSGELCVGGDLERVDFFPLGDLPSLKFPTDQKVADRLAKMAKADIDWHAIRFEI